MSNGNFNVSDAILEILPTDLNNIRILDIGFGAGQLTHSLLSNSGRGFVKYSGIPYVMGIDIEPKNVEFAKIYMPYYKKLLCKDATEIPYPPEFIENLDIAMCTQMVEHVEDKPKVIEMIKYVSTLAPLVIFTTPEGDTTKLDKDHKSAWYRKDFEKLGFKTRTISRYPPEALLILDILSIFLRGMPTRKQILAWRVNKNVSTTNK